MKGEIDKDFYCLIGSSKSAECSGEGCPFRRRKWPTPEQFREEYGGEWRDYDAVYRLYLDNDGNSAWNRHSLVYARNMNAPPADNQPIVCACTPWGKPADDWRPS